MAKKFASIQKIEQKYKNAARNVLKNEIKEKIKKRLKENMNKTVYSRPKSDWYDRTYAMRESVTGKIKSDTDIQTIISIFPNITEMGYNYPSIINSSRSDNKDMIVEWLNEGTSGSPIYNHPAHHFMDKTFEETDKIVKDELAKAFKRVNKQK